KHERVISFRPCPTHHAKNAGGLGGETGEVWVPDLKTNPTCLADLIKQAKDHINTLTPDQLAAIKAQEDLEHWVQSCAEAQDVSDLKQVHQSRGDTRLYYNSMPAELLRRALEMKCTFDKQRKAWVDPAEFNGISDEQLAALREFIDTCGLDTKTVYEHWVLDA